MTYKHEKCWATKGKYWNLPEIEIDGLVLHSVGCAQPSADVFVRLFDTPNATASVHGFIEPGRYVETAPQFEKVRRAKKCYHVGGDWNSSRIGIEMTEPSTIIYTRGAQFTDLNPEKTAAHIRAVTATAAEVFADLCIFHNLTVDRISTHAEAHRLGHGSGHVDPEHIWQIIGYTLADFRKEVQAIIDSKKGDVLANMTKQEFDAALAAATTNLKNEIVTELKRELAPVNYQTIKNVGEWAKPSVKKAMDAGIVQGTGGETDGEKNINLSADFTRVLVILDRLGLFERSETMSDPSVEEPSVSKAIIVDTTDTAKKGK